MSSDSVLNNRGAATLQKAYAILGTTTEQRQNRLRASCIILRLPHHTRHSFITRSSFLPIVVVMVKTRSGHDVFYTEVSYGRAARSETTRKRKKQKLLRNDSSPCNDEIDDVETNEFSGVAARTPRSGRKTRGQIREEENLRTPPSAQTRVGITPPSKSDRMITRGRMPTCSDYGTLRHFSFAGNGFFFCHGCDMWDSLPPDQHKNSSRASAKLACTAKHTSFSHPTTLRKDYCRRGPVVAIVMIDSTDDDSIISTDSTAAIDHRDEQSSAAIHESDDDCSGASDCSDVKLLPTNYSINNQPMQSELEIVVENNVVIVHQLRERIAMLENRHLILSRELNSTRQRERRRLADESARMTRASVTDASTPAAAYLGELLFAVNDVSERHNKRWNSYRTAAQVAKSLWGHETLHLHLLKLARKHLRDTVFTPFNILREMDLAGGTLSYEGIDVLRRVETCGIKRFRGSIIPSKSEIKRMAASVEWYAQKYCPFSVKVTSKGEAIEFDYAQAMLCIAKAFHLDEIGKTRSLSVASSIDGASLSKNLSIIAGGIKIIDKAARCPLTRRPLLDNPATMSAQSRNLCMPLKIMMGRETNETFTEFRTLFSFLDDLSCETTMPSELEAFKPFSCMTNCDLSAQWKGLGKGGAAKVHTLPCTGCAIESNALATPNAIPCARCCHSHSINPDWMCFHKAMATPERVASMQVEVEELLSTLSGALEEIQTESKMRLDDVEHAGVASANSTSDLQSIHFCPETGTQRQSYSRLLTSELILRGLDVSGTVEGRRARLLVALNGELTINRLSKEISHGEVREGAYFLLMQTLPCVLHMENRNGIKLLTMIFIEGLSNAKKKLLYTDSGAEGTRISRYVMDIERLINTEILGSEDDPCQWMCPYDVNKKELGPITMDNVRTRRVVDHLDIIVDLCVTDEIRKTLWTTTLNNYRIAMVLLRKREDFTNEMIATYQDHADKFYQAWILLWQKEGITNYLHMMGSGHISDYLYRWKNLYRFSQQGWEAMNSMIKTFFFRRTSHGGGVRGISKKSRLIPIARWLQRRLIFLCRIHEDDISKHGIDFPVPQQYRTQAYSEDDIYD